MPFASLLAERDLLSGNTSHEARFALREKTETTQYETEESALRGAETLFPSLRVLYIAMTHFIPTLG